MERTAGEEKRALEEELAHEREARRSQDRQLMSMEDVDISREEAGEQERVVKRLAEWVTDDRRYDDPGYSLQDDCVTSLLHIWQTDDAVRQKAMQWMQMYMMKVGVRLEGDGRRWTIM